MSKLLALVLLIGGSWLIYTGHSQAESLLGRTKSGLVSLQNDIDGKGRVPQPYLYYSGGAVLLLAGTALLFRRK
jgi:hypothetical protein